MGNDTLDTAAVATHEMFMAYIRAGFDKDQALKLVIAVLANARREPEQ